MTVINIFSHKFLLQISLVFLCALGAVCGATFPGFGITEKIPPYGIPIVPPEEEADEKADLEKGLEIAEKLAIDKTWPWIEKEFSFDKGLNFDMELGKEMEFEKSLGFGVGKSFGFQKAKFFPWALWEKYFGLPKQKKKITFEVALAYELYKAYGWYGLWIAKELERRFAIAKELGLIGEEVAFQEAINLGLFKGIGLDEVFTKALKAVGVEKAAETAAKETSFDKILEMWKKF